MSTSALPPGGPPEPADLVGTLFAERFQLAQLVSEGANTVVFDAVDATNGRTVTVKQIRHHLSSSPSFRERFDETMRSVAALSHPNIAAVYDWGITPTGDVSTAYVVAEQLSGGSLRDMFDRARRLTPSQALAVGLDACRALDHAHRRGFVHTELTPSKLVFGDDRRLRIIDFGLAGLLNEAAWETPDSVANHVAWYASPEQGQSQPIDGKTDVYALCLTLHEAVSGDLPFRNDSTVASLAARVGRLMPVSADLGPLATILEHAGRPEPAERSTAAEFGKELVQAASKLPRPEPLPLLSTGLFDTPPEHLRTPDDPTGGVVRPPEGDDPQAPLIVEAEPDAPIPEVSAHDDLVILPLDSEIGGSSAPIEAATSPTATETMPVAAVPPALPARDPAATAVMATTSSPAPPPPSKRRRRRRFPWKILLALVVIGALTVLGLLATRLFTTPVYIVPDLAEVPEAEARNMIAINEWVVTREQEPSDLVPEPGRVIRTAPQAGEELAEGEPFLIVVSEGPIPRELPDSTGALFSEAQTRLVERDLVVLPAEQFHELVPEGIVIGWSVPGDLTLVAGSFVPPGTSVELVISMGPAPREIPDVVGRTVGDARSELESIQLTLSEDEQQFSDDVALGSIIWQSIDPGTEVERGSNLVVVVSKGPDLVIFPDISTAATFDDAAAQLIEAGFVPQLTFGDAQGAIRSYEIDGRTPEIGETFRRGTRVDIEAL